MTISTTTTLVTYVGNGVTTSFSFAYVADQANDLVVTLTNLTTGTQTVLVQGTQYSVSLNAIPVGGLWAIGGSVTYPLVGSPMPTGFSLTIDRQVPYEQLVSISNQGAFYPQAVEQALDILELQIQQLVTSQDYSLQFPLVDQSPPNILPPAANRAGGYLGFDVTGQPIIVTTAAAIVPVSAVQPRKVVTTGTNTISVLTSDSLGGVSIYQSSSPVTTIQLPAGFGPYPIFDSNGNAGSFPIKILPPVGLNIIGQSSFTLSNNYQSVTCYNDGTQIILG